MRTSLAKIRLAQLLPIGLFHLFERIARLRFPFAEANAASFRSGMKIDLPLIDQAKDHNNHSRG